MGPKSAGADPGPACYLRGGAQPTITDANLVLGRLDPDYFLGGEMKLNTSAAEKAIKEYCASAMSGDVIATASGIIEIANANMLRAMRLASVQRGYDPRDFTVVGFGGAGPMHTNALGAELQIGQALIPPAPGLFSAVGLLVTDLKHDFVKTYIKEFSTLDIGEVNSLFSAFEVDAMKTLSKEGVEQRDMLLNRSMDMRYVGQSYELLVPIPGGKLMSHDLENIRERFNAEHERTYGHAAKDEPVEVVNVRLSAVGLIPKPKLKEVSKGASTPSDALRTERKVYFREHNGFVDCNVYNRYKLRWGNVVQGPAIIEEGDSTTVVHPDYEARVERFGFVMVAKR